MLALSWELTAQEKKYTWQETNANNHQVRLVWSESLIIKS